MKRIVIGAAVAAGCLAGTAATAQEFKRLSTQWKGPGMPLDVINGGQRNNFVQLAKREDVSGQMWKATKNGDWFNLTTEFRGAKMCLDVENGGAMNTSSA